MKLSVIFNALASGELANLHLADNAKSIFDDKKEIVLRSINLGLTDLHTRFLLKKKVYEVLSDKTTKVYQIADPECIEVTHVYVNEVPQFIHYDYKQMNTKTIEFVDYPQDNQIIHLEFKANHRQLSQEDIDNDTDVELPMSYLSALLSFIASRLYTSIVNQLDGDLNESHRYAQRYIQEIQLLTEQGIDVNDLTDNTWFYERGFI